MTLPDEMLYDNMDKTLKIEKRYERFSVGNEYTICSFISDKYKKNNVCITSYLGLITYS